MRDELELEQQALDDEYLDAMDDPDSAPGPALERPSGNFITDVEAKDGPKEVESVEEVSGEDAEKARKFREDALKKGDVDLVAIARTSAAVSASPPK